MFPFVDQICSTSKEFRRLEVACDRLGYSRPDSFLRAWRAAGLPIYEVPSGRKLISWSDFASFVGPEAAIDCAE